LAKPLKILKKDLRKGVAINRGAVLLYFRFRTFHIFLRDFTCAAFLQCKLSDSGNSRCIYRHVKGLAMNSLCGEYGDIATVSLPENWIGEAEQRVWSLFESGGHA
jgi:hypothetical protein